MKTEVRQILCVAVACMGLLPLTGSGSSENKADVLIARGDSCARKGDHDKAIADYTEAIRLDPKDAWLYSIRAKAFRVLGKEVEAAGDERKAQELGSKRTK